MDLSQRLSNFFSGRKKQPAVDPAKEQGFGNRLSQSFFQSPIGKGIVNVQKFIESPKEIGLPQVPKQLNPTLNVPIPLTKASIPIQPVQVVRDIVNTPLSWAAGAISDAGQNIGRTITHRPLATYDALKSPVTRLGYNASSLIPGRGGGYGTTNTPQQILGNVGGAVEGPLSVWSGGKILGGAGTVATNAGKRTFWTLAKPEIIQGARAGGAYGLASGLEQGRNDSLVGQLLQGIGGGISGAALGGAASGAVSTGSYAVGKTINNAAELLVKKFGMGQKQAQEIAKNYYRNELGQFIAPQPRKETPTPAGLFNNILGGKFEKDPVEVAKLPKEFMRSKSKTSIGNESPYYKFLRENGHNLPDANQKGFINFDELLGMGSDAVKQNPQSAELNTFQPMKPGDTLPVGAELKTENGQQFFKPQSPDNIINDAKGEIGRLSDEPTKTLRQKASELYTQWVDRYNPIVKLSQKAEDYGKSKGFDIRPEYNPKYQVRRFSGMGGMAEKRYNDVIKPVLDQIDSLKIDKTDLDVYLKARREVGFGNVGRNIYGSDPVLAGQRVAAVESKYGEGVKQVADKIYELEKEGFKELVQSGFIDPNNANLIESQNPDYVPFQRKLDDQLDEYLGMPSKSLQQGTNPIKKIKGSDKQIYSPLESVIANNFKQTAAVEKNNVAKSIVGLQHILPDLQFEKSSVSSPDSIAVWENGTKSYYKVGSDIADAVKGMSEESMNSFLKVLSAPAALLRQAATGRNPEFMLPNMVKDQFDAALNSKYGYKPVLGYIQGLSHMIKNDDVYKSWIESGGSQSFSSLSGRKSIQDMFSNTKTSRVNVFKKLGKWLDVAGKYSEQPTRVGLFANALKKTGNKTLAMYESREGTMDFARMGSKMKVANSLIPFLNVGVQGLDKLIRTGKETPGKLALGMGLYAVTPALMTTLYNTTQHPQEYSEIPQYVKDSNFVIVTGRGGDGTVEYISIPKGNVVTNVANPVENFISYLAHTNKQSLSEMATQFLTSALPVIGEGSSPKEVAIKTIGNNLPQAIKPATENLLNKSFFKYDAKNEESKNIVPNYMLNKPPAEQTYAFTPTAYQTIGKVIGISPLKVQNFLEGYLAGYAKIPSNLYETLKSVANGDQVEKNQIPILRRFMSHTYPTGKKTTTNTGGLDLSLGNGDEKKTVAQSEWSLFGKAQAAESAPQPSMKVDDFVKKIQKDGQIDALEKQQLSRNIRQISEAEQKIYEDTSLTDNQKRQQLEKLDAQKKKLQESDNKPKTDYSTIELTGNKEIDKALIAKKRGDITTKKNQVLEDLQNRKISATEAEAKIQALNDELKGLSSGTGGRKKKGILDFTKYTKALGGTKPVKVHITRTHSGGSSRTPYKAPVVSHPQIKQLKFKGQPMQLKKLTK